MRSVSCETTGMKRWDCGVLTVVRYALQAEVMDPEGQNLEVQLYDEDADKDDVLGRCVTQY